jgi:Flp pilus assembly protein CpaB
VRRACSAVAMRRSPRSHPRPARPTRPPRTVRAPRTVPPVRREVGGAPFVLPSWLDALSDRWWGLTPRIRASVVVAMVLVVAVAATARVAASPYGPPVPVLVATSDLPTGTVLDEGVLRAERWPAQLAPDGGRTDPSGTLTAPLPAGAVLTGAHVTEDGVGGMVGPGRAAVPLPAELVPELAVGTVVQVITSGPDGGGIVLADRAEVVAADGAALWLATPELAAADVAAAGLRGTVALAVVQDRPTPG